MPFRFPKSLVTLQISAGTTSASRFSELTTLPHFHNLIVGDCYRTLLKGMPDLVASIGKLQYLTLVGCTRVPSKFLKNKPPLKRGTRGINYLMRGKGKGYDRGTPFKWWFVKSVTISKAQPRFPLH